MKNAVFFDIDGTLWDEHMQVPKSTAEAVQRLRENGHYAFICSGRSRSTIRAKEILEDIGFDGILAGCGTHIEYHGEVVYERFLSKEEIEWMLSVLKEHHISVILEGKENLFLNREDFKEDPFINRLAAAMGEVFLPLNAYRNVNKLTIDCMGRDTSGIREAFAADYELLFHTADIAELLPKGCSKASGIQWICDYLQIDREHTYAFGDSINDLEMLRYVQTGIAMGNATEVAKKAADYVTSPIHEDGIYRGLKHFSLI